MMSPLAGDQMPDGPLLGDFEERFRAAAIEAISGQHLAIDSAAVWRDLVEGRSRIAADFSTPDWSVLVLERHRARPIRRLAPRTLEIFEQVLLGADPKVVSIERNLSASTVAGNLKHACEALGLRCRPSRVPLLLVVLAHAACGRGRLDTGHAAELEFCNVSYQALCMPAPDRLFARVLSPAEQSVVRMRVEGKSHAEIAAERRTSLRTVANQVAKAFHRLGVSCRSDLMELLIAPSCSATSHMVGATGPTVGS